MTNPQNKEKSSCCSCAGGGNASASCCSIPADTETAIPKATSTITRENRLDHIRARVGINRMGHRVEPGLYRLGRPDVDSPVFASANYTLSFDALRSALAGVDCYILVLDTNGINVWCAAGKGTFGTDELVHRIESTGLAAIVRHRKIILPQLGAPGVSWPDVMRRTHFKVVYGPVRAVDLPEFLRTGTATPSMRRVEFPLRDRLVLTPVEFVHVALPALAAAVILYFLAGYGASLAAVAAVLAGTVLFPALLPFIPTHDFSTKGLILGGIVAVPFAASFATVPLLPFWANTAAALVALLLIPSVTAYLALNFTGCTTFASRSGVKKEIFRYVPVMAVMAGSGIILAILLGISRLFGVI
ncbi:mercury methylation corrinoid protein HgcA [Methanogenium organophilum]|uniref:Mercury methylation corrinoid protein HgcA n=1 Tax=Methanogenium organophilum TaxID=2199 RepID=A0A9X9S6D6_METOG|nr:mercury methylation corrinoid protein HgcA [Methanogenium organophilum]WAI02287.1 mercury methylation corrinoid protein HgcA [Methanogenium organophilum]